MKTAFENTIKTLLEEFPEKKTGPAVLHLSQAVLNLTQALSTYQNTPDKTGGLQKDPRRLLS